jgi:hypothetical protein
LADPRSRRFLPVRSAGRGALPPDAAARAAGGNARLRRTRRLRGALPAPVGAPGALGRPSTGRRRATTASARSRSTRRGDTIVDAHGHVLVTNVAGYRVEAAGRPTCRRAGRPSGRELRQLATIAGTPVSAILKEIKDDAGRSAHAGRRRTGSTPTRSRTSPSASIEFPGVELAKTYLRSYPVQVARRTRARLRRPINGRASWPRIRSSATSPRTSSARPGSRRPTTATCAGTDGSAQLTVNSLGEPTSAVVPTVLPRPGRHASADDRHQPPAGGRARARRRINLAHGTSDGTYADGGAIVALNPQNGAILALASYPTYEPSVFVSRDPKKLAPLLDPNPPNNYPGSSTARSTGSTRRAQSGSR